VAHSWMSARQLIVHLQRGLAHLAVDDCPVIVWEQGPDGSAGGLVPTEIRQPDENFTADGFHKDADDPTGGASIHLQHQT
jgi:hypothetical protein